MESPATVFCVLFLLAIANAQFPSMEQCNGGLHWDRTLEKCFQDSNLQIPDFNMTAAGIESIDDVLTFVQAILKPACDARDSLRNVVRCMISEFYSCADEEPTLKPYEKFWPSVDKMTGVVDIVCGVQFGNFDVQCLVNSISRIGNCLDQERLAKDLQEGKSLDQIVCGVLNDVPPCLLKEMKGCGCATAEPIMDLTRGPLYPDTCGAPAYPEVNCDPQNPQAFSKNVGSRKPASWPLAIVSSALVPIVLLTTRLL